MGTRAAEMWFSIYKTRGLQANRVSGQELPKLRQGLRRVQETLSFFCSFTHPVGSSALTLER